MPVDHKIVCWGDYAIPVLLMYKWMAFDGNGDLYFYESEPLIYMEANEWHLGTCTVSAGIYRYGNTMLLPPQPGPWHTQLYWIGD